MQILPNNSMLQNIAQGQEAGHVRSGAAVDANRAVQTVQAVGAVHHAESPKADDMEKQPEKEGAAPEERRSTPSGGRGKLIDIKV